MATSIVAKKDSYETSGLYTPGMVFWLAFSILAVAMRGVRWDEAYEHAQILTGQVVYPEGHPLAYYVHNAFSLLTWLSARIVGIWPQPVVLCSIRNVLFLMASVLPVFLFVTAVTRRALWGHVAAVLVLGEILLEFDGAYPMTVWPSTYTNGHIGGGYGLIVLFLVATRRWKVGAFLLGLMPAIHLAQMPPVLAVGGLLWLWEWKKPQDRATAVRAAAWGLAGLVVCVLYWLTQRNQAVAFPTDGPFFSPEPFAPIWRGFTAYHDPHRRFPAPNVHIALVGALIAFGLGLPRFHKNRLWWGMGLFAAIIAAAVWGIMAIHAVMDDRIPFLLIGWMPYRLGNYAPTLWLVMLVCLLVPKGSAQGSKTEEDATGGFVLAGTLAFLALRPLLGLVMPQELFMRYIALGDAVVFGLAGASFAIKDSENTKRYRTLGLAMAVLLAPFHQFGAACLVVGGTAAWAIQRLGCPKKLVSRRAVGAVALVALAVLAVQQWRVRQHLPRSVFESAVADYLTREGEAEAMVMAGPDQFLFQAKTGHPVLVEAAVPSLMSYVPALGPGIQKVYSDVYGIRFDRPAGEGNTGHSDWLERWVKRSGVAWRALAEEYGFKYVVAPTSVELQLPEVVRTSNARLYAAR